MTELTKTQQTETLQSTIIYFKWKKNENFGYFTD